MKRNRTRNFIRASSYQVSRRFAIENLSGAFCRGSRVDCTFMVSQATCLPPQLGAIDHNHLALIWPFIRILDQTSTDRIFVNAFPFLRVAFITTQDVIEETRLP